MEHLSPLVFMLMLFSLDAESRDATQAYQFRKLVKCPSTGTHNKPCPGYVIDHVIPLCLDESLDTVSNMQWQEKQESYKKDAIERKICKKVSTCSK